MMWWLIAFAVLGSSSDEKTLSKGLRSALRSDDASERTEAYTEYSEAIARLSEPATPAATERLGKALIDESLQVRLALLEPVVGQRHRGTVCQALIDSLEQTARELGKLDEQSAKLVAPPQPEAFNPRKHNQKDWKRIQEEGKVFMETLSKLTEQLAVLSKQRMSLMLYANDLLARLQDFPDDRAAKALIKAAKQEPRALPRTSLARCLIAMPTRATITQAIALLDTSETTSRKAEEGAEFIETLLTGFANTHGLPLPTNKTHQAWQSWLKKHGRTLATKLGRLKDEGP